MSHFPIPIISDVDFAFPAKLGWLPLLSEVPEKWHVGGFSKQQRFFASLFYVGVVEMGLLPRENVDPKLAWRALQQLCGTYAIPHERKEATFAFLCDQWFHEIRWRPANGVLVPFDDAELEAQYVARAKKKPR
jgi:hypothetical protein